VRPREFSVRVGTGDDEGRWFHDVRAAAGEHSGAFERRECRRCGARGRRCRSEGTHRRADHCAHEGERGEDCPEPLQAPTALALLSFLKKHLDWVNLGLTEGRWHSSGLGHRGH